MLFSEVIGQNSIKKNLIETVVDNRISHALLFSGQSGYGTLPLSLAYAQYLLCTNKKEDDACGVCPSCKKAQKMVHPDLHFIFPVVTTKQNSKPVSDDFIEKWREFVTENSYFTYQQWINKISNENKQGIINTFESNNIHKKLLQKSFESEYKIMIIWSADKMNLTCANKILKILEEPPEKTLFILITESPESLLPTIISRTQIVNIPMIDEDSLSGNLETKHQLSTEQANDIAKISYGNYISAKEYIDVSEEYQFNQDYFISFMRTSWNAKPKEIINWVDSVSKISREKQKDILRYFLRIIRENLLMNINHSENVAMTQTERSFAEKFSKFVHQRNIEEIQTEINSAIYHIERNGYSKLIFFDLCVKTGKLLKM